MPQQAPGRRGVPVGVPSQYRGCVDEPVEDAAAQPELVWHDHPVLREPVLIAAFAGWNDAGDAATTALRYLASDWDAERVAEIAGEEFFDFTSVRPMVSLDDNGRRELSWPSCEVWAASIPDTDRDVVFITGIEPNLRWRSFANHVLDIASTLDVSKVITLGALLAEVAHSREVPIFGSSSDTTLQADHDLQPSSYEGPTGIVGVITAMSQAAGYPTMSLWAAVASYAGGVPSPKAAQALIERTASALDTSVVTISLDGAIEAYEQQVAAQIEGDDEVTDLVARLEAERDDYDDALEAGQSLADEVESFLRDHDEP